MTTTVLHLIDTWGPGGAETVCVELAAGLHHDQFRSRTAVIQEGWVHDAFRQRGFDPAILRLGTGPVDWRFLRGLIREVRQHRVGLIQSHLLTANLYSVIAGRLLGVPVAATFHGTVDVASNDRWAALKLRIISTFAARLVFVSHSLRDHYLSLGNVPDDRAVVIHNGIDTDVFRPAPNRDLRNELGFGDDITLVGAVGNLRASKGYDELLRVAARLRDSHPTIRFVIVGRHSQPLHDRLLSQRRELKLEDQVSFLGFRDDPARVLNGFDVYLSTSISEGFSLTTIQAMACGLPVVATRSGGPEEILSHARDGLLVPVGDTAGIADALVAVINNHSLRQQLVQAARQSVVEKFTLDGMLRAYEKLYLEVLAGRQ